MDQEGASGPVFVDASGRRSKKFRRAGWILAAVCACYAVTLVIALIGGSSTVPFLNLPVVPGVGHSDGKAGSAKEDPSPAPSGSAPKGANPGDPSLPVPTDSNGSPIPGASVTGTGKQGAPAPGASSSTKPPKSTTGATGKPVTGTTQPADTTAPGVPDPPVDPPVDSPTTPVDPPVDPPTTPEDPPTEPTDPGTPAGDTQAMAAEGVQ